jgi:hypothetical protein
MDNAAEQYDLVSVLWRLDGFRGIEGEIGQGHSIDERVAATDSGADGSSAKITCIAPTLGGAAAAIRDHVNALCVSSLCHLPRKARPRPQ